MYIKQNHIQPQSLADIVNQGVGLALTIFSRMLLIPVLIAIPLFSGLAYLRFLFQGDVVWLAPFVSSVGSAAFIWFMGSFAFFVLFSENESSWWKGQKQALKKWWKVLPMLLTGFILYSILLVAGGILFLIPGLVIFLLFMLFPYVIVFERTGVWKAFKRSGSLMKGVLFRGGCLVALFMGVQVVLHSSLLTILPLDAFWVLGVSAALIHVVIFPFQAVILAIFYFSVRAEKEAFDYEVFQSNALLYETER